MRFVTLIVVVFEVPLPLIVHVLHFLFNIAHLHFSQDNTGRVIIQLTAYNTNNVTSRVNHTHSRPKLIHNFTSHNVTIHHQIFLRISQFNTSSTLHFYSISSVALPSMSTTISSLPFSLPLRQNSRVTLFNPPSSPNPSQSSVTFPKKVSLVFEQNLWKKYFYYYYYLI